MYMDIRERVNRVQRWDYRVFTCDSHDPAKTGTFPGVQKHLEMLGRGGWELVSTTEVSHNDKTSELLFVLKKPV
jgi:hypothetical protein